MSTLFAFIGINPMELLVIMGVLLLLFGHRLPGLMRSLGRGIVEFKKGVQGVEEDFDEARRSITSDIKKNQA
jgi:sec-independent protein translocase protein TatA